MMAFAGKTVVVTGAARGIGAALVRAFTATGARVCAVDLEDAGPKVASLSLACDVSDEAALSAALDRVEVDLGEVDIFVSNAGILGNQPDHAASASNADWARCWQINVMAHVYAARLILPRMIARKEGHFVTVASAAGLLNQIGDAAYSATKHAAVSFAESLAITHADDGIGVSLVCPQYVATPMLGLSSKDARAEGSLLTAEEVADCVVAGVEEGRFLILPHPQVRDFARTRAEDHDRWIKGMVRLRRRALAEVGTADPTAFYKLV